MVKRIKQEVILFRLFESPQLHTVLAAFIDESRSMLYDIQTIRQHILTSEGIKGNKRLHKGKTVRQDLWVSKESRFPSFAKTKNPV